MDREQEFKEFLEQRFQDLKKKMHINGEPTPFQENLLRLLAGMPDPEPRSNPYLSYTPDADILQAFISEEQRGQEYVKYVGPWKKDGGQGHAVELVMLKLADGTEKVIGFNIWGITDLLTSLKEDATNPVQLFTIENFKPLPPGWNGEAPPEDPLEHPPGWHGEIPSNDGDSFDGWKNA